MRSAMSDVARRRGALASVAHAARAAAMLVVWLLPGLGAPPRAETTPQAVEGMMAASDRARGGGLPGIVWQVRVESVRERDSQTRTLVVRAKGEDSLVEFRDPPKVQGQKILTRGRNMWFVRPGLQKPVAISPRQRLLGDAANGDIAATNYAGDYHATFVKDEATDGEDCAVLELKAAKEGVTYDRILYYVSRGRQVGLKAEFFTVSGKLIKTATFEYANTIRYKGAERPFVSRMQILDALEPSARTVLNYADVQVTELPPSTFNLDLLLR